MTQEQKQLLLKDLSARLQYGVKLGFENSDLILVPKEFNIYTMQLSTVQIYPESNSMVFGHVYDVWNYRPYLRPMLSMTEEEAFEMFYTVLPQFSLIGVDIESDRFRFKRVDSDGHFAGFTILFFDRIYSLEQFDWLNSHYFDYRGLIDKGLALEAPKDMYKNE